MKIKYRTSRGLFSETIDDMNKIKGILKIELSYFSGYENTLDVFVSGEEDVVNDFIDINGLHESITYVDEYSSY